MTSSAIFNNVWNFCHTAPSPKRYGASVTCLPACCGRMMAWATVDEHAQAH